MNPQSPRQLVQRPQSQVFFGPLDGSHVGAVEIAFGRKAFLGPATSLTKPADIEGDNFNRIFFLHTYEDVDMLAIALQGIASSYRVWTDSFRSIHWDGEVCENGWPFFGP